MASMQLRVAAAALALGLVAGCGGDKSRAASADTTRAVGMTPDSAAMPVTDTTVRANTSATAAPATAAPPPSAGSDSGAKQRPTPTHQPKQVATTPARPVPDTAAPAGKPAGDTAAAAPAPSPAKQDTSAAAAAAESGGELRDAYHQAPRDTVSQAVYEGWKQFNLNCARCHGEDVLGTTIAPHLIVSLKPNGPINSKELFVQTVCAGRPAKGMPAWCALGLDMDKINNIYQYVKGRSDAKIGPGRPAVKREG